MRLEKVTNLEQAMTDEKTAGGLSALTDVLGTTPKFTVETLGGLHCLFLGNQEGPYIWGFIERGEAESIKRALNIAMHRAGCVVPNGEVKAAPLRGVEP